MENDYRPTSPSSDDPDSSSPGDEDMENPTQYMLHDPTKIRVHDEELPGIPLFDVRRHKRPSQYDIPMCGIPEPGTPLYGIQAPGTPLGATQSSWRGPLPLLGDNCNTTKTDNWEVKRNIASQQDAAQYPKNNIPEDIVEASETSANRKVAEHVQETASSVGNVYPMGSSNDEPPKCIIIRLPKRETKEGCVSCNCKADVGVSSDDESDPPSPLQLQFCVSSQEPSSSNNEEPFPLNNQGVPSPGTEESASFNYTDEQRPSSRNSEAVPSPARSTGYRRRSQFPIYSQPPAKVRKQSRYLTFQCVSNKDKENYFGDIELGSTNCPKVQIWRKCRVNLVEDSVVEVLLEGIFVGMVRLDFTMSTFIDLIRSRLFDFDIKVESSRFVLQLFIKKIPLYRPLPKAKYLLQCLFDEIYDLRFGDLYEESDTIPNETPQQVYKKIADYTKFNKIHEHIINENINVQHPSLKPELRPYQVNSIKWMLHRERSACVVELPDDQYVEIELPTTKKIFVNKFSLEILSSRPNYTKKTFGGILADEMGLGKSVEVFACILNNPRPEGDFLDIHQKHDSECPELVIQKRRIKKKAKPVKPTVQMGPRSRKELQEWYLSQLGEVSATKSSARKPKVMVECICGDFIEENLVECTDCSKKQHRTCMQYDGKKKDYICPQCWKYKPPLKSKATLIISPIAICKQWCTEVTTHVRQQGLRVLEYTGVQQGQMIYPTDLLKYDLVVTNYTVLQSELKFTGDQSGAKRLRHAKKYFVPVTPLISINWWRLCLDEAQAVESVNSNLMLMTLQIPAVHRWAVTGTPLQRNVNDLFGIIQYLQLSPYDDDFQWKNILYLPYLHGVDEPMLKFLSDVLWRTAKIDVEEQIRIPEQEVKVYRLDFSPIERYTYKSEFEQCSEKFIQNLNKFPSLDITINTLDKNTVTNIMQPLTHLRQICSHTFHLNGPHVGTRKEANSMNELLEIMLKKNKTDCEENLRTVIACLNGCAGIFLLKYDTRRAAKKYLRVLKLIAEYENDELIKVDTLQQIHTYYNLLGLIEKYNVKIPSIPDTNILREKEWALRRQYLRNFSMEVVDSRNEHQKLSKVTDEIGSKLLKNSLGWMRSMCDWLNSNSLDKEFANKLYIVVEGAETSRFTWDELMSSLKTWDNRRENCRRTLQNTCEIFKRICCVRGNKIFGDEFVKRASICHLRPDPKSKTRNCNFCKFDRQLSAYECQLFNMKAMGDGLLNIRTEGTWAMSNKESKMRTLVSFFKTKRGIHCPEVNQADDYLSYVEAQRREFKALRKLYTQYEQLVSAQDEIHICTIRYRLPDESNVIIKQKIARNQLESTPKNPFEFTNILSPHNLKPKYTSLREERNAYLILLQHSLGVRRYLKTLENEQSSGEEQSPCPICRSGLGSQWCVFSCGHSFCLECLQAMLKRSRRTDKHIICSVCREKADFKDILYIRNRNENDEPDIPIQGSHPTKIHEIIRLVLKLLADDSHVKIITFSSRMEVLKRLQEAFSLNNISTALVNHYKLHDKLRTFKREDGDISVLLMPMGVGSRGLNLIEATHVILVEPSLTLADELQAIGRVHRIGQTRRTTVHRFIMNESIEESIVNAIEADSATWADNNSMKLSALRNLFIMQEPMLAHINDDANAPPLDSDAEFTDDENGPENIINPNANEENHNYALDVNQDVNENHDIENDVHPENDDIVIVNVDNDINEEHDENMEVDDENDYNSDANNVMLGRDDDSITSSEQSCGEEDNQNTTGNNSSIPNTLQPAPRTTYRRNRHVHWADEGADDNEHTSSNSNPGSSSSNDLHTVSSHDVESEDSDDNDDTLRDDRSYRNHNSSPTNCRQWKKYRYATVHENTSNNSSDEDCTQSSNSTQNHQRPSSSNKILKPYSNDLAVTFINDSDDDTDNRSMDRYVIYKQYIRCETRSNNRRSSNDSDDDDSDGDDNSRNQKSSSANSTESAFSSNVEESLENDDYRSDNISCRNQRSPPCLCSRCAHRPDNQGNHANDTLDDENSTSDNASYKNHSLSCRYFTEDSIEGNTRGNRRNGDDKSVNSSYSQSRSNNSDDDGDTYKNSSSSSKSYPQNEIEGNESDEDTVDRTVNSSYSQSRSNNSDDDGDTYKNSSSSSTNYPQNEIEGDESDEDTVDRSVNSSYSQSRSNSSHTDGDTYKNSSSSSTNYPQNETEGNESDEDTADRTVNSSYSQSRSNNSDDDDDIYKNSGSSSKNYPQSEIEGNESDDETVDTPNEISASDLPTLMDDYRRVARQLSIEELDDYDDENYADDDDNDEEYDDENKRRRTIHSKIVKLLKLN